MNTYNLKKHKKSNKKTQSKRNRRTKIQKGKGLMSMLGYPKNNLKLMFKKARTSETKLISKYEKLTETVDNYYKLYNNHLENLIQLDTFLNNKNFETLFKTLVIKEHFKKHDKVDKKTLPLLLRNFNVSDNTSSTALRRESLIKQIRYKIHTTFPEREQVLLKDINVIINPDNEVIMVIKTVENKEYKRNIKHDDFILNMAFLNRELKDIMKVVKENLSYESNIYRLNNNNNYSMVNSMNIYKSHNNTSKKTKKQLSNNNMFLGNNMVRILDEGSNNNREPGKW